MNELTTATTISISPTCGADDTYQSQYKLVLDSSGSDNDRCLYELLALQLLSMPLSEPAYKNQAGKRIMKMSKFISQYSMANCTKKTQKRFIVASC